MINKKRIVSQIVSALLLVSMLAGCANHVSTPADGTEGNNGRFVTGGENVDETVPETDEYDYSKFIKTCSVVQLKDMNIQNPEDNNSSFKDSEHHYYMFYIGQMKNVGLETIDKVTVASEKQKVTYENKNFSYETATRKIEETVSRNVETSVRVTIPDMKVYGYFEAASAFNYEKYHGYSELKKYSDEIVTGNFESFGVKKEIELEYPGNYVYISLATVDVFAAVITDLKGNVQDIHYMSSVVSAYPNLVYLGEEDEYQNDSIEKIPFDVNAEDIQKAIHVEPKLDISGRYSVIDSGMTPTYCGKDKNYEKQPYDDAFNNIVPSILTAEVQNCAYQEGKYYPGKGVNSEKGLDIVLKLIQDRNNITTKLDGYSSCLYADTENKVQAFGTLRELGIDSVGYGTVFLRMTKDGNAEAAIWKTNVFSDAGTNEAIHLLDLFKENGIQEKISEIDKLEVMIVFEVQTNKKLSKGMYTNWKYEFALEFDHS